MPLNSINPSTGKLIKTFTEYTEDEVINQIAKAEKEFYRWRDTSFKERRKLILNVANHLEIYKEKYGRIITEEMGKPISQSITEIEKCSLVCNYYAEYAEQFLKDEIIKTEAQKSFVSFEPLGVILAIMPWNFPFWQVFRFAVPALMAGNTILLKHSQNVSISALAIEEIFTKNGFPEDSFKTLLVGSSRIEGIIKDERIKAVTLTGSEYAGSKVAELAGREIKKTVLELGGSDPFIVLEDADIDICAVQAVNSRLINTGQTCIAAKRFIVVKKVADRFEYAFKSHMEKVVIGNPFDKKTQIGPIAREDLLATLHSQVTESIEKGARLLLGGKRINREGYYYSPTILTDVRRGMSIYNEETFGPVAAIITVPDESEAISVANDNKYGLGASIWSSDIKRAESLARKIESGLVFINAMVKSDPRMPFGGIKTSGYGRELSHYGIKEFVNIKSIWIN